ncbi:MAG: response regulator transcription factor [bacterium]|nr:response regulator transcription factor [bacterium]
MVPRKSANVLILLAGELPDGMGAALEAEELHPHCCGQAEAAHLLGDAQYGVFDVVLVIAVPSAVELIESLRAADAATPLAVLCEVASASERVRLLRAGAGDVVQAPWDAEEVALRLSGLVRRSRTIPILRHHDLVLDLGRREVRCAGEVIDVSPKEFDLLRVLIEARGEVCSRRELLKAVWGRERDPGTAVVEVLVARLRRKLDKGGRSFVRTKHGRGYSIAKPAPNEIGGVESS